MAEEVKETQEVAEVKEKVFPINTLVNCLKGADAADPGLLEMLAFMTQADVDDDTAPVAAALSKAWIYELEPKLTGYATGDIAGLGAQVKVPSLDEANLAQAQAVLAKMAELKAENEALKAENVKLAAEKAEAEAKVDGLAAKVKVAEDADAAGEQKLTIAAKKIDDHIAKLNDLMAEVEKVKSQGVVVAGAAGGGDAAAPADAGGDAPSTGGEPEGDFGFGSNPFADSEW